MSANYDTIIKQGSVWKRTFIYKNKTTGVAVDITGYTAKMQIRPSAGSSTLIHEATSSSGIVITGTEGKLVVTIGADATDAMSFIAAEYDLEVVPPSGSDSTKKLVSGKVKLQKAVTV